jgi:hypothetical protein
MSSAFFTHWAICCLAEAAKDVLATKEKAAKAMKRDDRHQQLVRGHA